MPDASSQTPGAGSTAAARLIADATSATANSSSNSLRHESGMGGGLRADKVIRVTFDTNTLDRAVRPERFPKDPRQPGYVKVRNALAAGTLRGYFSETLVTLEGIENKDRVNVLGSTRLDPQIQHSDPNTLTINLTVQQDRKPLHAENAARIQAALKIGMRVLRGPPRIGWLDVKDDGNTFHDPDESEVTLSERLHRTSEVVTAIEDRGLGFARVQFLATCFAERDAADVTRKQEEELAELDRMLAPSGLRMPKLQFEEPWFESLLRVRDDLERTKVRRAVAEWADADSVAAHVGYGIDFFCSEDVGKSTGGEPSILDPSNRTWLTSTFAVQFLDLTELAAML